LRLSKKARIPSEKSDASASVTALSYSIFKPPSNYMSPPSAFVRRMAVRARQAGFWANASVHPLVKVLLRVAKMFFHKKQRIID